MGPTPETTVRLTELITLAGSQAQLAALLGVEQRVVCDWKRLGQISKIGALLVSTSALLSQFFEPRSLRPDLTEPEIDRLRTHEWFARARARQIEYEDDPEFAQTSLYYIQSRLGLLGAECEN
jgi:hypothetical protein